MCSKLCFFINVCILYSSIPFCFVQRLLVLELLSVSYEVSQAKKLCWSDELYFGEFGDLEVCNLYSEETSEPVHPRLKNGKSNMPTFQCNRQLNHEILQVGPLSLLCSKMKILTHLSKL